MQDNRKYRISDVVADEFLRMPLTLLANPKYKQTSLEAKFVYALLLNRLTLSQKNGWINAHNEVYLIYTREEAASTLNISYKKSIAAFKELISVGLLEETRQGRGYPNLLYVLKAELGDGDATEFAEDFGAPDNTDNEEPAPEQEESPQNQGAAQTCQSGSSRHAESAHQDLSKLPVKTCPSGTSRHAGGEGQDMPKPHIRKTENIQPDKSEIENSPSVRPAHVSRTPVSVEKSGDRQTDDTQDNEMLEKIYGQCELNIFNDNIQAMFKDAIERLYYSAQLRIGNAILPQAKVRSHLCLLNADVLTGVLDTLRRNETQVKNTTAYLMSAIYNGICEQDSGLILCLPPEYQTGGDFYAAPE